MQNKLFIHGISGFKRITDLPAKSKYQDSNKENDQVTPQEVIDTLSRYTVRKNGAYSTSDYTCGICQRNFDTGDHIISLPCQHTFHEYCIENWLKWVKSTCPIDKKNIVRNDYWAEIENEWCKSKLVKVEKEEIATVSTDQTSCKNNTLQANSNLTAHANHCLPMRALDTVGEYPIVVACLPMLQRFSYFMNSKGSCETSLLSSAKKSQVQELHHLNKNRKKKITIMRRHKSCVASNEKQIQMEKVSTTNSNSDRPYKWLPPTSLLSKQKGNQNAENEISKSCVGYDQRMITPKVSVSRPVTFASALKQPARQKSGWIYTRRVNSS